MLDLASGKGRRVLGEPTVCNRPKADESGRAHLVQNGRQRSAFSRRPVRGFTGRTKRFIFSRAAGRCTTFPRLCWTMPASRRRNLPGGVRLFAEVPTTGGTAIDSAGNIYVSDVDNQQILKVTPRRKNYDADQGRPAGMGRRDVDRQRGLAVDSGCTVGQKPRRTKAAFRASSSRSKFSRFASAKNRCGIERVGCKNNV